MSDKVLIIDDEVAVRDVFVELLKKNKFEAVSVSNGEEAIELLKKENFDAVLLDIKLQGMPGLEVLRIMKEIKPDLIVVMITGFGYDEDLLAKSKQYGCSGYLSKNMPVSQIINNFKSLIEQEKQKQRKAS